MNHIEEYNKAIIEGGIDKTQYGFKLDISGDRGTRQKLKDDRQKGVREAIDHFLILMKASKSIKAAPMGRMDFDGISQGGNIEYEKVTIVGFPYKVGMIQHSVGTTLFIKLGIIISKQK